MVPKMYGYGSIPLDTFLVGWTSIYQLFWGSLGTRVLTHPHIKIRLTYDFWGGHGWYLIGPVDGMARSSQVAWSAPECHRHEHHHQQHIAGMGRARRHRHRRHRRLTGTSRFTGFVGDLNIGFKYGMYWKKFTEDLQDANFGRVFCPLQRSSL